MSKANLGWLFYKKMYEKGDDDRHIKSTMDQLLRVNAKDDSMGAKHSFRLKTVYPGLLIGSGYAHGLSSDYDAKIGFYFDHTTGLPIIQGSSVKGMLRSFFALPMEGQSDPYTKEKHSFIRDLIKKSDLDVDALAREIFEGIDADTQEPKSIYERDIFYEARVVATNGNLLQDDYLTPHGDDPLKNPIPLRFVKVAPEVTFEFNFDLKSSKLATSEEKENLFIELVQTFGIGAKTNVGYGQFAEWTREERDAHRDKQKRREKQEKKAGLDGFDLLVEELKELKKRDANMIKKIKEYEGDIKDKEAIKEIVKSKSGPEKFYNRVVKYLDELE